MADQPPLRVVEPLSAPLHAMPSSARELRAQAVQRLQAGLFGLAAIVLIVGLADIITQRTPLTEADSAAPAARQAAAANADPLADAGVVPSASASPADRHPRPARSPAPPR